MGGTETFIRRIEQLQARAGLFVVSVVLLGALLLGASYVGWLAHREEMRFLDIQTRTSEVIDVTSQVQIGALNAIRGERGYLLTGNEKCLVPYETGLVQLDRALARLERGPIDADGLGPVMERLRSLSTRYVVHLAAAIALKREDKAREAVALVRRGEAYLYLREMDAQIAAINLSERAKLAEVNGKLRRANAAFVLYMAVVCVTGLCLLGLVTAAIVALRRSIERERAYREVLLKQAHTDDLTGLANRRELLAALDRTIASARRKDAPLAFAIFDIDHFKSVNDTFGHRVGDEAIRGVALSALDGLRASDTVGRIGGEEFAVVMPDTGQSDAIAVCNRLRERIRRSGVALADGSILPITISIGVARFNRQDTAETLIERADAALYAAKNGGRDQVRQAA